MEGNMEEDSSRTNGKDLEKINERLLEILGPECGLFGHVNTWGQRAYEYEPIGYILSEDFMPTLEALSPDKRKTLVMVMNYFEMHMRPLKKVLKREDTYLYNFYSELAWSHFATLVMFGMLEVAIKEKRGIWLSGKGASIKSFLESNLSSDLKDSVLRRYTPDKLFNPKEITDFGSVVDHMWKSVRGGFVHDAGIEARGLEWSTLEGIGSEEDPIRVRTDVPMQEWLQITWQAILNSSGYKGTLDLPRYDKSRLR